MYINRIILIGNGFDLAHDKKTSYTDFIKYYWFNRIQNIYNDQRKSNDIFCKITTWKDQPFQTLVHNSCLPNPTIQTDILTYLKDGINSNYITLNYNSLFFKTIDQFFKEKGWVDIEYQYYKGCFKLYKKWTKYRKEKGMDILLEENTLDKTEAYQKICQE